jgi:predicted membrane protein
MVSIASGDGRRPAPSVQTSGRHRAASIYGAIITAAIIAAVGGTLSTTSLVIAVVVTLVVYWVAEEYAEVLGEQAEGGRLPTWASIGGMLAGTWPMVSASYAPLLALVLARLAGASALTAANVGLAVAVILLTVHGWSAGRAAGLRGRQLLLSTSVALALGIVMILLKDVVLIHLH